MPITISNKLREEIADMGRICERLRPRTGAAIELLMKLAAQEAFEAGRSSLALEMAEKVKGLPRYSALTLGALNMVMKFGELCEFADVEALLGGKNG